MEVHPRRGIVAEGTGRGGAGGSVRLPNRPFESPVVTADAEAQHLEGAGVTAPARSAGLAPPVQRHRAAGHRTPSPTALAVDLCSCTIGLWASHRGTVSGPCDDASASVGSLVRRGRVVDIDGCVTLPSQLAHQYPEPVPAGGVVVACRPVLASGADQGLTPPRTRSGLRTRPAAGRRHPPRCRHRFRSQRGNPAGRRHPCRQRRIEPAYCHARGLLRVGDGARYPGMTAAVAGTPRARVHRAAAPRTATLNGARLAATSLLRRPAGR
jgi:rod shape-determining protein MreB